MGAFDSQQDNIERQRNFAKWEDHGQSIEGRVVYAAMVGHPFPDEGKPQQVPRVDLEDGRSVIEVTATQKNLADQIIACNPDVGDYLSIEYVEDVKISGRPKPMKRFRVRKSDNPETVASQIKKDKERRAKTKAEMPEDPPF